MKTTSVLVLFFLATAVFSHPLSAGSNATEGESCTPPVPVGCGEAQLISRSSTPAGDPFGPNVCLVERTYMVPTFTYEYKKYCHGRRHQFCYLACLNTKDCSSTTTFTKSHVECCEGFTGNATASDLEYFYKYYGYLGTPKKKTLKAEGCPREIQPTVLDCLVELELISLASMFRGSELNTILTSAESQVTVFAPSEDLSRSSFGGELPEKVLGTHVVNSTIPAAFLSNGQRLETLSDGLFLHISEVDSKKSEAIFVNGIKLSDRDACVADNGIVHVIERVVLAEERTLAEVVQDTEEVSIFNSLITTVGLDELLNGTKLLTVFAPTNDALAELDTDCLLREENEKVLKKFLLNHIAKRAEYSASLVLRDFVVTKLCYKAKHHYFYHYYKYYKCSKLEIQLVNDTILVGDDGAEVTLSDIPASNGVLHFISEPVTTLDLEELCPETSTSGPSTESPTTDTPSTSAPLETEATTPPEGGATLA